MGILYNCGRNLGVWVHDASQTTIYINNVGYEWPTLSFVSDMIQGFPRDLNLQVIEFIMWI